MIAVSNVIGSIPCIPPYLSLLAFYYRLLTVLKRALGSDTAVLADSIVDWLRIFLLTAAIAKKKFVSARA